MKSLKLIPAIFCMFMINININAADKPFLQHQSNYSSTSSSSSSGDNKKISIGFLFGKNAMTEKDQKMVAEIDNKQIIQGSLEVKEKIYALLTKTLGEGYDFCDRLESSKQYIVVGECAQQMQQCCNFLRACHAFFKLKQASNSLTWLSMVYDRVVDLFETFKGIESQGKQFYQQQEEYEDNIEALNDATESLAGLISEILEAFVKEHKN